MTRKKWNKLLNPDRLGTEKPPAAGAVPVPAPQDADSWLVRSRTESERDFDRVLFSTPTRRLGDKTQVFPLEKNESVRNRLTHSHEVADLARSIGTHIVHSPLFSRIVQDSDAGGDEEVGLIRRAIPAVLGATGLAHDMGNPPFGHQGEAAIGSWIARNKAELFFAGAAEKKRWGEGGYKAISDDLKKITEAHKQDFLRFEGNAQTLRTLTRLQVVKDNRGLNLSFGTLAAIMKYTVPSSGVVGKGGPVYAKKFGYYQSEALIASEVRFATGLEDGHRHPLTYIMEACDDAAYVIIDAEDAVKKQIVSFPDLLSWLCSCAELKGDKLTTWILKRAETALSEVRAASLSSSEQNDVCTQIFRSSAITAVVSAAIRAFEGSYDVIMESGLDKPLLETSVAHRFLEAVRTFDRDRAYSNRRVLEIELSGYNTLLGLMDMLWRGITEREQFDKLASKRTSPFARYAYSRISENYRRVFEGGSSAGRESDNQLPIRYKELQLLTDMVAGMTDQFAIDLHDELKAFHVGASLS